MHPRDLGDHTSSSYGNVHENGLIDCVQDWGGECPGVVTDTTPCRGLKDEEDDDKEDEEDEEVSRSRRCVRARRMT